MCFQLPRHVWDSVADQYVDHLGSQRRCRDVVTQWAQNIGAQELQTVFGFALPSPWVDLLSVGAWRVLALVERDHLRGKTAVAHFRLSQLDPHADLVQGHHALPLLDASRFRLVSAWLRGESIVDNANGLSELDLLAWLDRVGDFAEHGPEVLMEQHRQAARGMQYRSEALIEAVLLADLIKSSDNLLEVIERSICLWAGPAIKPLLETVKNGKYPLPGKSLISRYRLSMDVVIRVVLPE